MGQATTSKDTKWEIREHENEMVNGEIKSDEEENSNFNQ